LPRFAALEVEARMFTQTTCPPAATVERPLARPRRERKRSRRIAPRIIGREIQHEIARGVRRDPCPPEIGRLEIERHRPFLTHHAAIERAIAAVTRRYRLSPQEAGEFAGDVRLRLLEGDCRVLRQFKGESGIQTFLAVVVRRMLFDQRTAAWGRFRPSAAARRMGTMAVRLERLIARDGLTVGYACETLRVNHGVADAGDALETIAARLPHRPPRRIVGDNELGSMRASAPNPEDALRRSQASRALSVLDCALAALSPGDRLLIRLRFVEDKQVSEIAGLYGLEQKRLYRKFEALLRQLRDVLRHAGIEGGEVLPWLGELEPRAGVDGTVGAVGAVGATGA
jgi:RNA polymerase sigma factor (sigma-70 family)